MELVRNEAARQRDAAALIYLADDYDGAETLTYGQLDRRAQVVAAELQARGLEGHRALLIYPPGLDFVAAFMGCLYAKVVAVPISMPRPSQMINRVRRVVDNCTAQAILTNEAFLGRIGAVLDQQAELRNLALLDTSGSPGGRPVWREPDVRPDTLAMLQYTSGSTGDPRGVMLTHANLLHNCRRMTNVFGTCVGDVGCCWLPAYHDMGLIGGILQTILTGQKTVLLSPLSFLVTPKRWLEAISHYRCTTSAGPNFAYDLCVHKVSDEELSGLDLSCWKVAATGSEPIRAQTLRAFAEKFRACGFPINSFAPCYGLAEGTLLVTGTERGRGPSTLRVRRESLRNGRIAEAGDDALEGTQELVGCGRLVEDQMLLIVDPQTRAPLPDGRIGEIWVSSPSVAPGYWRRHELSRETFGGLRSDTGEGPFLRSGDLGFLRNGELFVTGRLKEMLIVRGRKVFPNDVETTVAQCHPALSAGRGTALTVDDDAAQRVVVLHEVENGYRGDLAELISPIRCALLTEHGLAVDTIALVGEHSIPRTSSGKVKRHDCRDGFLGETLKILHLWHDKGDRDAVASDFAAAPGMGSSDDGELGLGAVLRIVRRFVPDGPDRLTADSPLDELGIDSLKRMEILAALQKTSGRVLPLVRVSEVQTCRQLAAAVATSINGAGVLSRPANTPNEIPSAYYRIAEFPEYLQLRGLFDLLAGAGVPNPYFRAVERVNSTTVVIDGRELVNFSSYDYLGLSGDPRVAEAVHGAIRRYGTSSSASRLVAGERQLHSELEVALAEFLGTEAALVFVGGHATNETTLGHLLESGDLLVHDSLAHNSIRQGAVLSGAERREFSHNDWQSLDCILERLRSRYRRVVIAVEGIYSMDGDIVELRPLLELKRRHRALLYIDEAHSLGVLGGTGRGVAEHFGVAPTDVDIWMGTLSKSLGSCGGYVAGGRELIEYLKYTAPGFVYAAGISPPNAAAALAALRQLRQHSERTARLRRRASLFLTLVQAAGIDTGRSAGTSIVPVIIGDSLRCLRVSQSLYERGVNVQPIIYPAVEEQAARLRYFITSEHSEEQIREAVAVLVEEMSRAGVLGHGDDRLGSLHRPEASR